MLFHENQWPLFTVFTDYLQYRKVFYFRVILDIILEKPCFIFLDLMQYFLHLQKVTPKITTIDKAKILLKSQNALKSEGK